MKGNIDTETEKATKSVTAFKSVDECFDFLKIKYWKLGSM